MTYFFCDRAGRNFLLAFYKASLLISFFYVKGIAGVLQIQQIQVPHLVLGGRDVTLECMYKDIQSTTNNSNLTAINPTNSLYSLKWYKGSWEFYRHIPRETPSSKVFLWSDFKIEADDSQPGKVILRNVSVDAEGSYKCEVSSEGTFHTDAAEANMTIIDIQNETMILYQEPVKQEVWLGDRIRWTCSFGHSRPPAHLSWLVNGELVEETHGLLTENRTELTSEQNRFVESFLELVICKEHFKDNVLRIKCIAQIGTVFNRSKELHVRKGALVASAASHKSSFAVIGGQSGISKPASSLAGITETPKSRAHLACNSVQHPIVLGMMVITRKLHSVLSTG